MKNVSTLFFLFLCTFLQAQTSLSGKVTDADTGEELIAANITLFKGDVLITGLGSDFEGNYSLMIDPGTYDVEVSYVGYQTNRIVGVLIKAGQDNKLDIQLTVGGTIMLDEISVIDFKVPLVEQDNTTQGAALTSEDIRKFAKKDIQLVAASTPEMSTAKESDRSEHKAKKAISDAPISPNPVIEAGQLTAGEWKDLDNWTFWQKLMDDKVFSNYQTHWNYHPQQRFSVKVSDEEGRALANISVQLINQDGIKVWETKSDNRGGAELWGNFFKGSDTSFTLKVKQADYEQSFEAIAYTEGINSLVIQNECSATREVDVVFVVDVTGSMSDELRYLKAEAMDVIQRTEEELQVKLRTGAVCYTDRGEANPLRSTPFSTDKKVTIDFLQNQSLGAGGDYPEAVDLGLGHAINNMDWNEAAIARIVFLMLDAPPHHVDEELKSLEKSIEAAAAKGIKIIPIASSGINKETEFLLKFFAMATNGTYTFLTDHSGIGNSHIKPEAGDYNIETLNDLLVRLIEESSEYHDCAPVDAYIEEGVEQKRLTRKERRDKDIQSFVKQIKCFPNPATTHVFIDMEEDIDLLLITDGGGKRLAQLPKLKAGQVRIDVANWAGGLYFFHFYKNRKHIVERVVVSGEEQRSYSKK